MRKIIILLYVIASLYILTACFAGGDPDPNGVHGEENPETVDETQQDDSAIGSDGAESEQEIANNSYFSSPDALAWRESVLESPLIAEAEHDGVRYEVRVYETIKYTYNTGTGELISSQSTGDARGTVLRDWVVPHGSTNLDAKDALFDTAWANTGSRLRELIGYCEENYKLVTRARTAEYVEYIYKAEDGEHYRIAATDDYILYSPLVFKYIFDIGSY